MQNPDSIGSFIPSTGSTGFSSSDTIGSLPQLQNLPKDVLDLLKQGEVDQALALLALLQQSSEAESQVFWGKLGQNVMMAFTLPMQMILSMMQSAQKGKKIEKPAKNLPAGNHNASFSQFIKMHAMKTLKLMKGLSLKIAKVALFALKGAQWTGNAMMRSLHQLGHAAEYMGKNLKTVGEYAEAFIKKIKEKMADAAMAVIKVFQPIKEKMHHAFQKAIEHSKEFAEQTAAQAAQIASQAVSVLIIPLVNPFLQFSLERLQGEKFSLKGAAKKLKNMGKWLARKAKTAISIVGGAAFRVAEIVVEKVKSLLEWLLEFMVRFLYHSWLRFLGALRVTIEILKFTGMLLGRLVKYFLGRNLAKKIAEKVLIYQLLNYIRQKIKKLSY